MADPTEVPRRIEQALINGGLVETDGPTWTTDDLVRDFEVLAFLAPYVHVRRKADGVLGTMRFKHAPRVYFDFEAD